MRPVYNCDKCSNQYEDPNALKTVLVHDWEANKYNRRDTEGSWVGRTQKYCIECLSLIHRAERVGFGK